MKKLVSCFLLFISSLLGNAQGINDTAIVFEVGNLSLSNQLAVSTIQGIVNRQGPKLYLTNMYDGLWYHTWSKSDSFWIDYYLKNKNIHFDTITSLTSLFYKFKNDIKGIVLYNPEIQATITTSLTMAGLFDVIPIDSTNAKQLPYSMFTVKYNLSTQWSKGDEINIFKWAFINVLPLCNKTMLCSMGNNNLGIDYPIKEKAFIFNISYATNTIESIIIDSIFKYYKSNTAVYGWGIPTEGLFMKKISEHNFYNVLEDKSNLSFHNQIQALDFSQKWRPTVFPKVKQKYYISFMMPEGDTYKILRSFYAGHWTDSSRGSVPINWGISPLMSKLTPGLFEYYYSTAKPNDYFFSSTSGAAYTLLQYHNDIISFAKFTDTLLQKTDITIVDTWGDTANWTNAIQKMDVYAANCPTAKGFTASFKDFDDEINYVSNKPFLSDGFCYWKYDVFMTQQDAYTYLPTYTLDDYANDLASNIREKCKNKEKPYFTFVYLDMLAGHVAFDFSNPNLERNIPLLLNKTAALLDTSLYEIVCLDQLFSTLKDVSTTIPFTDKKADFVWSISANEISVVCKDNTIKGLTVNVSNLFGISLMQLNNEDYTFKIPIANLASGVYILTITRNNEQLAVFKVFK